jgi:DNA polymerase-1
MLQLVTDHTRLMTTRSGVQNTIIYDPERIRERYDLRPDQIVDFKALKGDSTDNVPGVPGVGEVPSVPPPARRKQAHDGINPHAAAQAAGERPGRDGVSRSVGAAGRRSVRDLPVELDLEPARLGDYDRETVVRLFGNTSSGHFHQRPPLSGERAEQTVGRAGRDGGRLVPGGPGGQSRPGWGRALGS